MLKSAFDIAMGYDYETETFAEDRLVASREVKTGMFTPQNFSQYIGQEKAKTLLLKYIDATNLRGMVFPHLLVHGNAGCGKTSLVKLVARSLGVEFKEIITSEIEDFEEILMMMEEIDGGILFLDEIHGFSRDNAEKMYSIMQNFEYNGQPIKPFTLVGATTELGEIIKNRKPFYDRFKIVIELQDYSHEELERMVVQYKAMAFPEDADFSDDVVAILAKNCRLTPRKLQTLAEATVYFQNVDEVLSSFDIIEDGFTRQDLMILKYIAKNEKGVGMQALTAYLNVSQQSYIFLIEPYLLRAGYILRAPRGRKITDEGLAAIKKLEARLV